MSKASIGRVSPRQLPHRMMKYLLLQVRMLAVAYQLLRDAYRVQCCAPGDLWLIAVA